jgi:hypothetical protein
MISRYKGIRRDALHGIGKKMRWGSAARNLTPAWLSPGRPLECLVVKSLPSTLHGQADSFAPTQWSVIVAAGESQTDPESSRAALAKLCETYWPPLYTYLRARGLEATAADGFPCYPMFEKDTNLDNLRRHPGFVAFLATQRQQWEYYLSVL